MPSAIRAVRPLPAGDGAAHGLVYISDDAPGIQRQRRGAGFCYRLPDGSVLRDKHELARIRSLAIPPAYTSVWICTLPHGHLQATGRDARGRKQYRYHPEWRTARDSTKFERMQTFGAALPRIRARVKRDLALSLEPHVSRRTVLATLVRLLDTTLIRVGNDEYARENGSFGLTTLRNRHAALNGSVLRLQFRGKSGVSHRVALDDPRVARVVRRCQALPGEVLFQYEDGAGVSHSVGSADVNEYLRAAGGADFSAKDFRTWHASVHALALLQGLSLESNLTKRRANELIGEVAKRLGNTVAVCRKSYVHPRLLAAMSDPAPLLTPSDAARPTPRTGFNAAERALLHFLGPVDKNERRSRRLVTATPSP